MPPVFTDGPFVGVPLCFRSIEEKSRLACMTSNRKLSDPVTAQGSVAHYNQTGRARSVAVAAFGGFHHESEARALFTAYTCPQNNTGPTDEAQVVSEIAGMIGSLYDEERSDSARREVVCLRHGAIAKFVQGLRTRHTQDSSSIEP